MSDKLTVAFDGSRESTVEMFKQLAKLAETGDAALVSINYNCSTFAEDELDIRLYINRKKVHGY